MVPRAGVGPASSGLQPPVITVILPGVKYTEVYVFLKFMRRFEEIINKG